MRIDDNVTVFVLGNLLVICNCCVFSWFPDELTMYHFLTDQEYDGKGEQEEEEEK